MAIEFDCPSCSQLVKTPDAAAGKKGRCPHCKSVVQIPAASTTAEASRPPISEAETRDMPIEADEPFEFACPSCGSAMKATSATVGKKGRCAACKSVVVIPTPPVVTESAPAREEIDEDSLIARFHEEEEEAPAPAAPIMPYGRATGPIPQSSPQAANPWAAWGQASRPATPPPNPFLSALEDAAKSAPEAKLNPYATTAMTKAAEKGVAYNWDEDLNYRTGLAYELGRSDSPWGDTFREVLFDTDLAFRRMFVDREVGKSVIFLNYGASVVGIVVGLLYAVFFLLVLGVGLASGGIDQDKLPLMVGTLLGMAATSFVLAWLGAVIQAIIAVAISSGVHHLMLMVTGRLQRGYWTTFKVNAYITGTCLPLCIIPCINFAVGLIAPILLVVGIRRAHGISLGRAIGVVVLPYMLFIGLYVLLIVSLSAMVPPAPSFPAR